MNRLLCAPLLWAAATLFATAAVAQGKGPPQNGSEIVVTGNRDREGAMREFVGALTVTQSGQLSRFERSICPHAIGLPPAQKQAIAARIRQVAKAANIAVGKETCTPNVLVVVTSDKAAFVDALFKQHPDYFGELSPRQVRKLARVPGPVAVWHVQGPQLDADGEELVEGYDGLVVNRTTRNPSRLTAAARPQFAAAAMIVEARALAGLNTVQLADYAAMRTFARTDPSKLPGTAPTILNVLNTSADEAVASGVTDWDLAFLKSLYTAQPNITAAAQRSGIRKDLKEQLEKGEGN